MANITSAKSGDANDPTVWVGGVVPVAPNCAIIANGHTVENPVGYTWTLGDSTAPATPALRTAGTGGTGLFINRGTLQLNADVLYGPVTWSVEAGGVVEGVNTTSSVVWYVGDSNTAAGLNLNGTGIGSQRAVMQKGVGSAGFRIRYASGAGGPSTKLRWRWARLTGLGSASDDAIRPGFNSSAAELDIENAVFDGCGLIAPYLNIRVDNLFRMKNVTTMNGVHASRSLLVAFNTGARSKDAIFEDCSFDKQWKADGLGDVQVRRCLMRNRIEINSAVGAWEDVMLCDVSSSGNAIAMYGTQLVRGFRVRVNAAAGNWHGITLSGTTGGVDGTVFDGVVLDSTGDLIQTQGTGVVINHVRNVVVTKSDHATGSYGKLCGIATATSSITSVKHNTYACAPHLEGALVNVGETSAGSAGMVGEVRHNIAAGVGANSGLIVARLNAGAAGNIKDAVTPANVTDNVCPRPVVGGAGVGIAAMTAGGGDGIMFATPIEAPLDEEPYYVDERRNLATWFHHLGGTPDTVANDKLSAIAAIASQNTDSPVAGATQMAAWYWIRAGKAPRNPRLRTGASSENGGWIGAVEGNSHARYRARARRR